MAGVQQDRGMKAVARARSVRERDSRIGLQHALRDRNAHRDQLAAYEEQIITLLGWQGGDASTFLAKRQLAQALGQAAEQETERLDAAQQVADAAHEHWSRDKVRLSAVESLLERRAAERRAERARREAAELDDIASQLWLRSATAAHPDPDHEAPKDVTP